MTDVGAMRRAVARDRAVGHVVLWGVIVAALLLLVQPWAGLPLGGDHPTLAWLATHPIVAGTAALFAFFVGGSQYRLLAAREKVPLAAAEPKLLGPYTAAQIQRIVDDVVRALAKQDAERPAVFVLRSPEANALSINAYFLNRSREKNAIYLNSFILRTVSPDELAALVGHELAHFYGLQNPVHRAPLVVGLAWMVLFVAGVESLLAGPVAAAADAWVYSWWGTPLVFLAGYQLSLGALFALMNRRSHEHELLADLAGAELAGVESAVNALLKVGARQVVLFRATEEALRLIDEDPSIDLERALLAVRDALPDEEFTVEEARALVRPIVAGAPRSDPAPDDDGETSRRGRTIRRLQRQFGTDGTWQILGWEAFDTRIRDRRLDRAEIAAFVAALRRNERARVFPLSVDDDDPAAALDHPSFRRRVINLAEHFGIG